MRFVLLALLVSACGGSDVAPVDRDERFIGRWFVEETVAHALYGASTYAFHDDGTVELLWDAGYYNLPQGHVVSGDVICQFGDTWSSADDRLLIDASCTDGVDREIVLHFTSAAATNATGATVQLESVGGESGWDEPQWGWSFRKCTPDEECVGLELTAP